MMKKFVLFKSQKNQNAAGITEICLTFLTTQGSVWKMIPLMIWTYCKIKWHFPCIRFHSLNLMLDEKPRVHFFDLRFSSLPILSLLRLKKICMKLERNRQNLRKADIDVYIFNRQLHRLTDKITKNLAPSFL